MKVVILAGGLGTRLAEETTVRPKPMVEVGGRPILWHIMKIYSSHGLNDFVVCLGYTVRRAVFDLVDMRATFCSSEQVGELMGLPDWWVDPYFVFDELCRGQLVAHFINAEHSEVVGRQKTAEAIRTLADSGLSR